MNILSPGVKTMIGLFFLIFFFGCIGVSGYILKNPIQEMPVADIEIKAIDVCKKEALNLGYTANGKRTITISSNGLDYWEKDIAAFSMILYKCDGFELKNYCMGRSCLDSKKNHVYGSTMKIRYTGKKSI
jgi:hypothetical protein